MTVPPPSNHLEKRRRFSKMRNPGSGSEPFRQATKACLLYTSDAADEL